MLDRLQHLTRESCAALLQAASRARRRHRRRAVPADLDAFLDEFDTARGDLVSLLMNLALKDWERIATDDSKAKSPWPKKSSTTSSSTRLSSPGCSSVG